MLPAPLPLCPGCSSHHLSTRGCILSGYTWLMWSQRIAPAVWLLSLEKKWLNMAWQRMKSSSRALWTCAELLVFRLHTLTHNLELCNVGDSAEMHLKRRRMLTRCPRLRYALKEFFQHFFSKYLDILKNTWPTHIIFKLWRMLSVEFNVG